LLAASTNAADQIGLWYWTWTGAATAPTGSTLGLSFSGWTSVSNAISESAAIINKLPGTKILTLGGGNDNGYWTASNLASVTTAINNGVIKNAGYAGIAYDIERGDAGLGAAFLNSFAAAKTKGLIVIVTVSHSTPFGVPDTASLMSTLLSSTQVDYMSPQLYSTGEETANEFDWVNVPWTSYRGIPAKIIPSIVDASMYPAAKTYFATFGITLSGFIQWSQGPAPAKDTSQFWCGTTWADAGKRCGVRCPTGRDTECVGAGGFCFSQVACAPSTVPPPTIPPPTIPPPTIPPPTIPPPTIPPPTIPPPTIPPPTIPPPTTTGCAIQAGSTDWWITILSSTKTVSVKCASGGPYSCSPSSWNPKLFTCSPTAACKSPVPVCTGLSFATDLDESTELAGGYDRDTSSGFPGWAIALVVVGAVGVIGLVVGLFFLWRRRNSHSEMV